MAYICAFGFGLWLGWSLKTFDKGDYQRGHNHGFVEGQCHALVNFIKKGEENG